MMPLDPPPTARGVKRQQSTCDGSSKCGRWTWARRRAMDEGSGEEGGDGKGDGNGDDGVL